MSSPETPGYVPPEETARDLTVNGAALELEDRGPLEVFGVKLSPRKKRSPEEIRALQEKIAFIARVFSRQYDSEVLPSPDGGWACGVDPKAAEQISRYMAGEIDSLDDLPAETFRPRRFYYDTTDVEETPEDEVLGVLRHEVGHARHSDYRLFFTGQRQAREEGYLPTSWMNIANPLEDPWVNNREIADSEVVRQKMTKRYAAKMPEIIEKIGTQPVTRQLGLNIIHYWLTGENIPTLTDRRALDMFEKIKPHVEAFFRGKEAAENFELLREKIWPLYRSLEQPATEDETVKEVARALSGSRLGSGGGEPSEGEESGETAGGSGRGRGRAEKGMLSQIKKALGMGGERGEAGSGEDRETQQRIERALAGADPKLHRALKKELDQQERDQRQAERERRRSGDQTDELPPDIDLSKLPPELVEQLRRIISQLDSDTRQKLEQQARQSLDRKQAEAIERDGPKHLRVEKDERTGQYQTTLHAPPEDRDAEKVKQNVDQFNQEQGERAAEQAAQRERETHETEERRAQRLREELERQDMMKQGFDEGERELYHQFKALEGAMAERIRSFMRVMDRYLPKKETYEHGGEYYTGTKINPRSVVKRAPVRDYRVFERREPVESPEPRMFVTLLIDNSGSMRGDKMNESLKTAIFWARVLKEFNIPFAVKFFGDQVVGIMDFDDDYDDAREKIKVNLVKLADASGEHTDIGSPLSRTTESMAQAKRKYPDSFGAVFVISDSGANHGMTGESLQEYIKEMQKNQVVMNFILSQRPDEIAVARQYFGGQNVVAPKDFRQLPDESFRVLRVVLERIMKVYRPTT